MNVLIVGYGEMGKHVETILKQRNHTIVGRVDPFLGDAETITPDLAAVAEVAIEFSIPAVAVDNIRLYTSLGLNVVMATTGWHSKLAEVQKMVEEASIGFIYGSNYSIGAHIFFKLVKQAVQLINPFPNYDVMGYEIHHHRKKDSPSGTARSTAEVILENSERKKRLVTDKLERAIEADELHFASLRGGDVPGVHKVLLDCTADTIEVSHTARSRLGFAEGAVLAAEWLAGKKGCYKVEDFIEQIFKTPV